MEVLLQLKPGQVRRLQNGHRVQMSAKQVAGRDPDSISVKLFLMSDNIKNLQRAVKQKKGVRIELSRDELERSGEGLADIWKGIKKGAKWVKRNIVDSDFYQKNVRPMARKAIELGIDQFAPAPAQELLKKGAEELGRRTSAFGIHEKKQTKSTPFRLRGKQARMGGKLESTFRDRASPFNPAMFKPIPTMSIRGQMGGSFRAI